MEEKERLRRLKDMKMKQVEQESLKVCNIFKNIIFSAVWGTQSCVLKSFWFHYCQRLN